MKIILQTLLLKNVLDVTSRFIAKSTTLPILQHLYIKWNVDSILIRATDMEKYIDVEIPAQVDTPGVISVDAKTLTEYIKSTDDESISIIVDMNKHIITLKTKSDTIKIKWLSGAEYVGIPELQGSWHKVPAMGLWKGINKVDFAVQDKSFVPVLQWVAIKTKEYDWIKKFSFAWSDSLRLADYKIAYDGDLDNMHVIIPKNNIAEIKRWLEWFMSLWGVDTSLIMSNNLIGIEMQYEKIYIKIVSLLISWTFPEYENENVMPSNYETTILVNKSDIEKAIKKVNILTRDTNYFVMLDCDAWASTMVCDTGSQIDMGEAQSVISADITGPSMKIGLNGKHVLDIMRIIESDMLQINLIAPDKPIIIKDINDPYFTYVCKPINV